VGAIAWNGDGYRRIERGNGVRDGRRWKKGGGKRETGRDRWKLEALVSASSANVMS